MLERTLTVGNRLGLHARASAKLVKRLASYEASVFITFREREVNAKSMLGLMTLAAPLGSELQVRLDGPDEEAAWQALSKLFQARFDES